VFWTSVAKRNCAGEYNLNKRNIMGFKKERTLTAKERRRIGGRNIQVGYRLDNLIIWVYFFGERKRIQQTNVLSVPTVLAALAAVDTCAS
jgi:hypothetical protein